MFTVHVHHHYPPTRLHPDDLREVAQAVLAALSPTLKELVQAMTATQDAITQLQADVTAENTVVQSAITLIDGIPGVVSAALKEAGLDDATNAAAVAAVDASLKASSGALSQAVAANTAPPTPTPAPTPGAIAVTPSTLPAATQGQTYSQGLTASGGAGGPYVIALSASVTPPDGIGISAVDASGTTATLQGTPTANAVTGSVEVVVTDSAGAIGSFNLPLTVNPAS